MQLADANYPLLHTGQQRPGRLSQQRRPLHGRRERRRRLWRYPGGLHYLWKRRRIRRRVFRFNFAGPLRCGEQCRGTIRRRASIGLQRLTVSFRAIPRITGGGAASGALLRCKLLNNIAVYNGGGCSSSDVTQCVFEANTAETGGGMYGYQAERCVFRNNSANSGGAVAYAISYTAPCYSSTGPLKGPTNCLFTGNHADAGAVWVLATASCSSDRMWHGTGVRPARSKNTRSAI